MKFLIVFIALFSVAYAYLATAGAPFQQNAANAETIRYVNDNIGVEGYNYAVETSDGKSASEQGVLKNVGSENEAIAVQGQYSYVGNDGVTYGVSYTADENGFQPKGDHLPQ